MHPLLNNKRQLVRHITATLYQNNPVADPENPVIPFPSAVLFLLGEKRTANGSQTTPCLILNKRSQTVAQPGDLCFPGGGMAPGIDPFLAKLLRLPGFSISRWAQKVPLTFDRPENNRFLALQLATCLRESFEEMGLFPFAVRFLGPLPSQQLVLFKRIIYPMAGWIRWQKNFRLNGEVEKIIYIPLSDLLNPANYALFQLAYPPHLQHLKKRGTVFPCFVHRYGKNTEILWGATYRIAMVFMAQVFGFTPPETTALTLIHKPLTQSYFSNNHHNNLSLRKP